MSGGTLSSCFCSQGLVPLAALVTPSTTRFRFFIDKFQLPPNANITSPRFLSLAPRGRIKALARRAKSESPPPEKKPAPDPETITFLVTSCGLSPEAAASAARRVRSDSREKARAVIQLLRDYTFSDDQIDKIARRASQVLEIKPEKVKPGLDFLLSEGFSVKEVADILESNYRLFQRRFDRGLVATYRFLSATLPSRSDVIRALRGRYQCLTADVEPKLKMLRDNGMPEPILFHLVVCRPSTLMHPLERLVEAVKTMLQLGLDPKTKSFVYSLTVVASLSREALFKKMKFHQELGISESDSIRTLKGYPDIFKWDDERLRRKLDFFKKIFGWGPADALQYPLVLALSLEGKILPRVPVLKVLMSKGLIENKWLGYHFVLTDELFIKRCVTKYLNEVPDIVKIFEDSVTRYLNEVPDIVKISEDSKAHET